MQRGRFVFIESFVFTGGESECPLLLQKTSRRGIGEMYRLSRNKMLFLRLECFVSDFGDYLCAKWVFSGRWLTPFQPISNAFSFRAMPYVEHESLSRCRFLARLLPVLRRFVVSLDYSLRLSYTRGMGAVPTLLQDSHIA